MIRSQIIENVKTRLDYAKWLAEKGLSIFIVEPGSKRPLGGHSWYTRQSSEPEQIADWFAETPNANFGVHTGDSYVVIDLDVKPHQNGVLEFRRLCEENGIDDFLLELDTLIVRTPGGGYHLYFRVPFPCANKNYFPDGIDVRGAIGYVVGPGSELANGHYEVIDPDAPIADAPDWLLEYLEEPGVKDPKSDVPVTELDQDENVAYALKWLGRREPAIEGQNGDSWTYETISFLRDYGLSESKIFEVLNSSGWNARCEPPWGDGELEAKIENAWRYAENRPGCKSPTYRVQRLRGARPAGGWGDYIVNRTKYPLLAVDNTALSVDVGDDEIPEDDISTTWDALVGFADDDEADDRPLSGAELSERNFPRVNYAFGPFFPIGFVSALDGDGGVGKTHVMEQIAVAIAAGKRLWNRDVVQMPVLLVLCEDDYGETKFRLKQACEDIGVNLSDLPLETWCRPNKDSLLGVVNDNGTGTVHPFYEKLCARLEAIGQPCFLLLDTIVDVVAFDEIKRPSANAVYKRLIGSLCLKYGTTIVTTRHPSKKSMEDGTFYSGGTANRGAVRFQAVLEGKKDTNQVTLRIAKANYTAKDAIQLFYLDNRFSSMMASDVQEKEQAEKDAVLAVVLDLLEQGINVVRSHGDGQTPEDVAKSVNQKYRLGLTKKDVKSLLSALERDGKLRYAAADKNKRGHRAGFRKGTKT